MERYGKIENFMNGCKAIQSAPKAIAWKMVRVKWRFAKKILGDPKSSMSIGFLMVLIINFINHPFWGATHSLMYTRKCWEYLLVTVNRCKMKPAPANIYSPEVMAALRSRGGWTWAFHHQALFLICENVSSCSSVSRSCRYIIGGYLHVYLTCPCVCVYI